jgi:voltage-gated potassium channel
MRTSAADVESHCVRPVEAQLQRIFDIATAVSAVVTIPVVIVLTLELPAGPEQALETLNWCLWGVFVAELVAMLAVTRDRRHWLRTHPVTPVVVLLTLPPFEGLAVLRAVRLLRGRVARRVADGVTSNEGLRNVALLTLLTVGLGGFVFAQIEPGVKLGDGLYWAVTTVTTTGYGDIVPTTSTGKALSVYVMLLGAAFLAILTGSIAQRFVGRWQRDAADGAGAASGGATAGHAALSHGPAAPGAGQDAVLAKLDELGERLAALERALGRGGR